MGLEMVSDGCGSAADGCSFAPNTAPAAKAIDQSEYFIGYVISLSKLKVDSVIKVIAESTLLGEPAAAPAARRQAVAAPRQTPRPLPRRSTKVKISSVVASRKGDGSQFWMKTGSDRSSFFTSTLRCPSTRWAYSGAVW
jgi:hypothetical protein